MSSTSRISRKPKGVRNNFAFFVHDYFEQHRKEHSGDKLSQQEIIRKCGEAWKSMDEQQKKPYNELGAADRSEMASTLDGQRRKKWKDPNAPETSQLVPLEIPKFKQENPGLDAVEISNQLGKRWKEKSASDKQVYRVLADRDKARYNRELEVYKQRSSVSAPDVVNQEKED
ncbi:High mobility group protein DSP1 [Orchesella cincta]|uniref:High mobility group protein DSP1 n=1 Tax=Orchesella cincta TaxID=48709 RepID=A0A1D2M5K2_ORCCI|nr:High mobility group protein DSP1 [Orchesella cincta]